VWALLCSVLAQSLLLDGDTTIVVGCAPASLVPFLLDFGCETRCSSFSVVAKQLRANLPNESSSLFETLRTCKILLKVGKTDNKTLYLEDDEGNLD